MGKVRYIHYPRSIVEQWELKPGELLRWVHVKEGDDSFVKVRKVRD